jgi:ketosteroid isomerase-like protein
MRTHSLRRLILPGLITVCAAAPATGQSPADRRTELLAQAADAATRAAAGDFVAALTGLFAPQGIYLSNTPELLRGPAGARTWIERDSLATRSRARWTVVRGDVSADGRDGYTYGYFDVIHPAGDTIYLKYQAYWRRSPAGRWEILAFSRGRRAAGPDGPGIPTELAAANTARHPGTNADTAAILREIEATEAAFSDSVGVNVAAAFGGFAAPDAGKLEGGSSFVFGKAAITALFASPPPGQLGPVWRPQAGSAAASGDLGFTLGPAWARQAGPVQTGPPPNAGRYFTIWKRQRDGTWRFLVD